MRVAGVLLAGLVLGVIVTLVAQRTFSRSGSNGQDGSRTKAVDGRSRPANPPTRRSIVALGTLEPREGPISIGSALAGYQIREIRVVEGQSINEGDLLIELDASVAEEELRIAEAQKKEAEERQKSEIDLAQHRLAAADLAVRQATDAQTYEVEAQQKQVEVAELKVKQAKSDLQRLQSLQRDTDPLVSAQQVEHQQVLLDIAVAELAAAKVALSRLTQSLEFQYQKATSEQQAAKQGLEIAQRGTGLAALDRRIELARLKLGQTKVVAPAAGTVISVLTHPGEVVVSQPLLQIANLNDLVCNAEVEVADVPLLHDKRKAVITGRAFRDKQLEGKIERVRNLVNAARLRPIDPRTNVDRSVTTVVIGIDANDARQSLGGTAKDASTALMGLQVEVEIPL